ncbi:MAG: hypothetical protein ACXWJD_09935 [Burkholderiaceae bacterium]
MKKFSYKDAALVSMVSMVFVMGSFFAWHLEARAASPASDGAITTAGAQEPPLCTDKQWLKKIKVQYEALEEQRDHLKVKEISDVKQVHFGPSPASVNQYATKTTYGVTSRYCQGTAILNNGKTDPTYWRMDYLVERNDHSINFDHCSLRHDLLDAKCQKHREGKD